MRKIWLLLAGILMAVTLGDAYTTWACLHEPVPCWEVLEWNPVAEWLFETLGLVPGLVVDSVITLVAALWVARTTKIATPLKVSYFTLGIIVTSWAVCHNYQGMVEIGIA